MDDENPYQAPQSDQPPPQADGKRQLAIVVANCAKIAIVVIVICLFMGWISYGRGLLLTIPAFFAQLPAAYYRSRWLGWFFLALFVAWAAWVYARAG